MRSVRAVSEGKAGSRRQRAKTPAHTPVLRVKTLRGPRRKGTASKEQLNDHLVQVRYGTANEEATVTLESAACVLRLSFVNKAVVWDMDMADVDSVQRKGDRLLLAREGKPCLAIAIDSEGKACAWENALCKARQRATAAQRFWDSARSASLAELGVAFKALDPKTRRIAAGKPLLHLVCSRLDGPLSLQGDRSVVTLMKRILRAAPRSAAVPENGKLPLQIAIEAMAGQEAHRRTAEACAGLVLEAFPDAAYMRLAGKGNRLPIHAAAALCAEELVYRLVFIDCPERRMAEFLGEANLLLRRDENGFTALHHAVSSLATSKPPANLNRFAALVCRIEPLAAAVPDAAGDMPTHLAARFGDVKLLDDLLAVNSGLKRGLRNNRGTAPSQLGEDTEAHERQARNGS